MPAYADVSVRYGIVDGGYYAFETKKYKNLDKLGDALPAGCKQAVKDAVDNGVGLYKTDIKDEPSQGMKCLQKLFRLSKAIPNLTMTAIIVFSNILTILTGLR